MAVRKARRKPRKMSSDRMSTLGSYYAKLSERSLDWEFVFHKDALLRSIRALGACVMSQDEVRGKKRRTEKLPTLKTGVVRPGDIQKVQDAAARRRRR